MCIRDRGGTAKGLMSNVEAISDNEFELEDIPQDTQCILVPVSYTHLDVYKRQSIACVLICLDIE